DALVAAVKRRRPDVDPTELISAGWPQLHRKLDAYLAAGLTKFVIRPALPSKIDDFIDRFVAELVPREN
ncbi:MAG TPA: TIGR03854 family LLM class F420-dependent oxidoreductase, partial [Mycobacterium sp.]